MEGNIKTACSLPPASPPQIGPNKYKIVDQTMNKINDGPLDFTVRQTAGTCRRIYHNFRFTTSRRRCLLEI